MNRRRFLITLTGLVAAPAVVKADNIMRVFTPAGPPLVMRDGFILCNGAKLPPRYSELARALGARDAVFRLPDLSVSQTQAPHPPGVGAEYSYAMPKPVRTFDWYVSADLGTGLPIGEIMPMGAKSGFDRFKGMTEVHRTITWISLPSAPSSPPRRA